MRTKAIQTVMAALIVAVVSTSCSGDETPADDLDRFLRDVAAAEDDYFAKEHHYTANLDDLKIDAGEARAMNLVMNLNPDIGYCLEGDDEAGTWHLQQNSDAVLEGDCP